MWRLRKALALVQPLGEEAAARHSVCPWGWGGSKQLRPAGWQAWAGGKAVGAKPAVAAHGQTCAVPGGPESMGALPALAERRDLGGDPCSAQVGGQHRVMTATNIQKFVCMFKKPQG